MLESLLGPITSIASALIKRIAGKPHFRLFTYVETERYEDRDGAYLALILKIANVGRETAYFDRAEGRTSDDSRIPMLVFGIADQAEVAPNRSVTGSIPAGFLLDFGVTELHVYDAVERRYVIKKKQLKKLQDKLRSELARLESRGYQVKWKP